MTSEEQRQTLTLGERRRSSGEENGEGGGGGEGEEDEREMRELEREVKEMGERILHYRRTIPTRLAEALSSRLVSQRPRLPLETDPDSHQTLQAGIGGFRDSEAAEQSELSKGASPAEADQEILNKLLIFRAKTSSNIAAMPNILKRMNECIARIDKVNQYNVSIHPVFKKERRY